MDADLLVAKTDCKLTWEIGEESFVFGANLFLAKIGSKLTSEKERKTLFFMLTCLLQKQLVS